jgi:NAD(P)-dependent dehydrogenase (short-subunit alcohol dehydrogenase family)
LPALVDLSLEALLRPSRSTSGAPLGLVQAALPMLEARSGLIVNISSDAAVGGYRVGRLWRRQARWELVSLTLANELKVEVAVVAVDPGDMHDHASVSLSGRGHLGPAAARGNHTVLGVATRSGAKPSLRTPLPRAG